MWMGRDTDARCVENRVMQMPLRKDDEVAGHWRQLWIVIKEFIMIK